MAGHGGFLKFKTRPGRCDMVIINSPLKGLNDVNITGFDCSVIRPVKIPMAKYESFILYILVHNVFIIALLHITALRHPVTVHVLNVS